MTGTSGATTSDLQSLDPLVVKSLDKQLALLGRLAISQKGKDSNRKLLPCILQRYKETHYFGSTAPTMSPLLHEMSLLVRAALLTSLEDHPSFSIQLHQLHDGSAAARLAGLLFEILPILDLLSPASACRIRQVSSRHKSVRRVSDPRFFHDGVKLSPQWLS